MISLMAVVKKDVCSNLGHPNPNKSPKQPRTDELIPSLGSNRVSENISFIINNLHNHLDFIETGTVVH